MGKPQSKKDNDWFRRIEASRKQMEVQRARWKRNLVLLLGSSDEDPLYKGSFAVNLAWAAYQTLVAVCFARIPRLAIRPAGRPELDETGIMLGSITEHDFEQMSSRYHTRMAIQDVFWAGYGVVEERLDQKIKKTKDTVGQEEVEYDEPDEQRYVLERINPEGYLVDSACSKPTMRDAAWVAKDWYPTVKELREGDYNISEDLLKRLPKVSVAPYQSEYVGPMEIQNQETEDDWAQVACREIWSRKDHKIIYMPKKTNEIIYEKDWPVDLKFNGELLYPFSVLYFNEHPNRWYPIPELTMIAPQLEQFSLLTRQIIRDAVQKWRKFVVNGGYLEKGHAARIVSGTQNSLIYVRDSKIGDPTKFDIKNLVFPIPEPDVKRDVVAVSDFVKGLIHEIIGVGDFAAGGLRSTRSATEAAKLADFLNMRMSGRTECIEAFQRDMAIRHVLYLQETLTESRTVRLTDSSGMDVWREFNSKNIKGEFDFRVLAGSSQPENTETVRQEATQFYQLTLMPLLQGGGDIQPLIEWVSQYVRIPRDYVDRMFNGRRQALMQLAQMFLASHKGKQIPPQAMNAAIAAVIQTGLSPSDQAALEQAAAQPSPSQPPQLGAGGPGPTGGAPPPAQPGGLPGTNSSDQLQ